MNHINHFKLIFVLVTIMMATTVFAVDPETETVAEKKLYDTVNLFILRNDYNNIKKLLPELAKIKKEKYSAMHPLFFAIGAKKIEAVKLIGSEKSLVNIKNNYNQSPIAFTSVIHTFDIFHLLLKLGADPNSKLPHGTSLLVSNSSRWDKQSQYRDAAFLLLDYNADPNLFRKDRYSPLSKSIMNNDEDYFDKLIQHNADPNLPSRNGKTYPLDTVLTYRRKVFFTKRLLHAGADINLEFEKGKRFSSVALESPDLIWIYARAGAKLNQQDKKGETALINTVQIGLTKNVKALLEVGVDITIKDNKGMTALDWAIKRNKKDKIKLIKQSLIGKESSDLGQEESNKY